MGLSVDFVIVGLNDGNLIIWIKSHHIGKTDLDFALIVLGLSPVFRNDGICIRSPLVPSFLRFIILSEDEAEMELLIDFALGDFEFGSVSLRIFGRIGFTFNRSFAFCRSDRESRNHILSGKNGHSRRNRRIVVHGAFCVFGENVFDLMSGFFGSLDLRGF